MGDLIRSSPDAAKVNRPRVIGGLPWQFVVMFLVFIGLIVMTTHNFILIPIAVIALLFLNGAGKRDSLFFTVFHKHSQQGDRYSPAPVSTQLTRNRRPLQYGRYCAH